MNPAWWGRDGYPTHAYPPACHARSYHPGILTWIGSSWAWLYLSMLSIMLRLGLAEIDPFSHTPNLLDHSPTLAMKWDVHMHMYVAMYQLFIDAYCMLCNEHLCPSSHRYDVEGE